MAMAPENKVHRLGAILVYSSVAAKTWLWGIMRSLDTATILHVNLHRCIVGNLTAWVKELCPQTTMNRKFLMIDLHLRVNRQNLNPTL